MNSKKKKQTHRTNKTCKIDTQLYKGYKNQSSGRMLVNQIISKEVRPDIGHFIGNNLSFIYFFQLNIFKDKKKNPTTNKQKTHQ